MSHSDLQPLPKIEPLPGVVCYQWKTCGKPNCRCSRGQLHGPYPYRFWREDGRLRKAYVRREALAQVQAGCDARGEEVRRLRDHRKRVEEALALLRQVETIWKP